MGSKIHVGVHETAFHAEEIIAASLVDAAINGARIIVDDRIAAAELDRLIDATAVGNVRLAGAVDENAHRDEGPAELVPARISTASSSSRWLKNPRVAIVDDGVAGGGSCGIAVVSAKPA